MRTFERWIVDIVQLKYLKESYPIEVSEYKVKNGISDEQALSQWVPYTIKNNKVIISKLKLKYWQMKNKYGIRIPESVGEAYILDQEEFNTLCRKSMDE